MEENSKNLPPGFRFHPTDEELITYYLSKKVSDFGFSPIAIADVDLNKCEPWDLPGKASMGEKEWYFFNLRDRKYPTGLRTNRATEAGYWKTTGKDKEIFRGGSVLVGMKKTLVFYRGRAPKGEKTNWVMHEYRREPKHAFKPTKEEWVVCRVFQKSNTTLRKSQQTTSSPQSLESPCDTSTTIANESGDNDQPKFDTIVSYSSHAGINSNIYLPNYDSNEGVYMGIMNSNINMNATLPLLPWSPPLLSSNLSSVNSLLLRALQFRGNNVCQPTVMDHNQAVICNSTDDYACMPQGLMDNTISQFGNELINTTSNFMGLPTSSSVILDFVNNQQHSQERPYKEHTNNL
ncbi:unnamed protein product [Cuscuta epithymum]|uniref:NAC domain-containing protein n=1 Tax=Cuscuta epithymum TaxID=186058 RepID=A0AAV0CT19_9ASTE|nr:unnamed protein product [Cuscuta epithymum]